MGVIRGIIKKFVFCGIIVAVFVTFTFFAKDAQAGVEVIHIKVLATKSKEKKFGKVDPSKALVYIIRPSSFAVGASNTWTFCDDKLIGLNGGKSYFFTYLEPGNHLIWSKARNISPYEMDFEAGKIYYFIEHISTGLMGKNIRLEAISNEEGQVMIERSKFQMLTPTATGWRDGAKVALKNYPKAEKKWLKRKRKLETNVVTSTKNNSTVDK